MTGEMREKGVVKARRAGSSQCGGEGKGRGLTGRFLCWQWLKGEMGGNGKDKEVGMAGGSRHGLAIQEGGRGRI